MVNDKMFYYLYKCILNLPCRWLYPLPRGKPSPMKSIPGMKVNYIRWRGFSSTPLGSMTSPRYFHYFQDYSNLSDYHSGLSKLVWITSDVSRLFVLDRSTLNDIIIIIMSRRQHGYPWPSLATSPYYSSPLAGLQGYILCPHIAAVCKFELVVLLLLGHMWGPIGVYHLWARPCFSSSVLRVWFV